MKKLIVLFISCVLALSITSCKSLHTFYQVCKVDSSLPTTAQGAYEYKDNVCTITYDFWCEGGNAGFLVTNNIDEIIYIDLEKSFFVKNGIAFDYYLKRTVSSSYAHSVSVTSGKSATAYGYWYTAPGVTPGSISVSTDTKSTAHNASSISTEDKSVIAVPPHSSKFISEYCISSSIFATCEMDLNPHNGQAPTYNFSILNTPISFSNYITYRVGDIAEEHHITNDFFVSSLTIYPIKDAIISVPTGCPKDKEQIKVVRDKAPNRYYNTYEHESKSAFSDNSVRKNYEW